MSNEEWEQAEGVVCHSCGKETLRLIDKKCPRCYWTMVGEQESIIEEKTEKRHVKRLFLQGKISRQDLKAGHY
jgi:NMD protein affecting ribosome stability and mRNA decay